MVPTGFEPVLKFDYGFAIYLHKLLMVSLESEMGTTKTR